MLYLLLATIYIGRCPVLYGSMSASFFEQEFGGGMHNLRYFDFYLFILSIPALILWFVIGMIASEAYADDFEWNLISFILVIISIVFHFCTTSELAWMIG